MVRNTSRNTVPTRNEVTKLRTSRQKNVIGTPGGSSAELVERKIQLQNIYSGVTKHAEITPIGVLLDELADLVFAQSASFGDARDLELGITQADFWIES